MSNSVSRFELDKAKAGVDVQIGLGIRWKVKRHSFNLSTGYQHSNYSIITNEYPRAVDPYNPFVEDVIKHTHKFEKSRVMVNLGITL
jgi:hypothetical protein